MKLEYIKKKKIYIFDLDGTIADITHRLKFIEGENKDWLKFHKQCKQDRPIMPTVRLMQSIRKDENSEIWIVTGRNNYAFQETMEWLGWNCIPFDRLYMRQDGDFRHDHVIKKEWLDGLPQAVRKNIVCAVDDRKRVVDMWRSEDIQCFQVADGDY